MTTKLPDNELIRSKRSSDVEAAQSVPGSEGREFAPAQPRHADAAKLRPDPSTSETIQQTEVEVEPQDQIRATGAAAPPSSKRSEADQRPTEPLPATNTAGSERAEIARRIAAFRNLQLKLKKDRESYFDETMAHTRELLSKRAKP
ncbi:hypothetical protein [Rhodopseudomonas sp. B29]|uniref:hypothetical protein n=1 Tax=Rhodopseudomonas sp. B29 TaxID=95607 RepID=UPI00034CB139|nr:hypothetical protein [Rhodopseudomonas sp. B29]